MSLHQLFCTNEAIAREVDFPFLLGIDPQDRNHVKALRAKRRGPGHARSRAC